MHTVHQCGDMTEHGCSSLSEGQSCQRAPHVCDLLISVWEGWKETLSPAGGGGCVFPWCRASGRAGRMAVGGPAEETLESHHETVLSLSLATTPSYTFPFTPSLRLMKFW